jgi:phosphatidylserine/phosphatidylglycerophosphate/cardiolipin synthase-like enzyme
MPTWDEQLNSYLLQAADVAGTGGGLPHTSEGNLVKHHIDGINYFAALRLEIEFLLSVAGSDPLISNDSDPFFYVIGWHLGLVDAPSQWVEVPSGSSAWQIRINEFFNPALALVDGSDPRPPLMIDKLEEMSTAGVDVRVLGWVSPLVLNNELVAQALKEHAFSNNINTILSVEELRRRNGPGSATLMTIGHPLGSMHLKTVVAGTANGMRAYVSGIDLVATRIAGNDHGPNRQWHDAGVEISGPAAEAIYSFYRELWNEQIDRRPDRFRLNINRGPSSPASNLRVVASHFTTEAPSITPPEITPPISERHVVPPHTPGNHVVQVLRTVPNIGLSFNNADNVGVDLIERILVLSTERSSIAFAPNGIFEFSSALRHAINAAQRYIYIEDQAFWAIEVMQWINARLKAVPELKVILVWGKDDNDPPVASFIYQAINNTLLLGIENVNDRIRLFRRELIIVHSKITIIDDLWAAVGSTNCTRRSLYTDGELSVSVMENSFTPFAQVLRKDLWGELCGLDAGPSRDPLLDLELALAVIEPTWGTVSSPPTISLLPNITKMRLPFEYSNSPGPGQWSGAAPPTFDQSEYDIKDPDSR